MKEYIFEIWAYGGAIDHRGPQVQRKKLTDEVQYPENTNEEKSKKCIPCALQPIHEQSFELKQ